ncbi:MAG: hypothetical protein CL927_01210 [Deltaproteobacteria bacterium]|nr:hypothetical protein [Deltaproteobacteria bacterium]
MRMECPVLSRGAPVVGLLAALACGGAAHSADWPDEQSWVGLAVGGEVAVSDDRGEIVAPYLAGVDGGIDCVGNAAGLPDGSPQTALLWYAEPDTLFFRIRVDADPSEVVGTWSVFLHVASPPEAFYEFGIKATRAREGTTDTDTDTSVRWVDNRSNASTAPHWQDQQDESTLVGTFANLVRVVEVVDGGEQFGLDADYFFDIQVPRSAVDVAVTDQVELHVAAATGGAEHIADLATDADLCGVPNASTAGTPPDLADVWSEPVIIDADRDGLTGPEEERYGTDPDQQDTDGDGLEDGQEVLELGTDPTNADSDNDGIGDGEEYEGGTDPLSSDSDGDGLSDGVEQTYGTDPSQADSDGDGITDAQEHECNSERRRDSDDLDADGLPDAEERSGDRDGDGLPDYCDPDDDGDGMSTQAEIRCGSDPHNPDTDADGLQDGDESCERDSDGDGVVDIFDEADPPTEGGGLRNDAVTPDGLSGGRFAGGSCSVAATPWSALAHAFIALLAVATRRRRLAGLFLGSTAASTPALAQDVNAQTFTPAVGARDTVRVRDSTTGPDGGGFAALYNHASNPLVYRRDNGTEVAVLGTVGTLDLQGWTGVGRFRLGFDLPLHLVAQGYGLDDNSPPRLGDLSADLHYEALQVDRSPVGLALYGGVIAPTGDGSAWVGDPSTGAYVAAALTRPLGPMMWSANLGYEARAPVTLPDDTVWGARVPYGLASTVDATELLSLSAELFGEAFTGTQAPGVGVALEGLASVQLHVSERWSFTGGAAKGFTSGLGTPDFRAMVGAHAAFKRGAVPYGGVDTASGGTFVATQVAVVSAKTGASVGGATIELKDGPDGAGRVAVPPNTGVQINLRRSASYSVTVRAPGDHALDAPIEVPANADAEWFTRLHLTPVAPKCTVTFVVHDSDGRAVPATVHTVPASRHTVQTDPQTGSASMSLPSGEAYEVLVTAAGFSPDHLAVACREGPTGEVVHASRSVILRPPRARLDGTRIAIDEHIRFESDSDIIDARSKGVLDDVARVFAAHPEIEMVEAGRLDPLGFGESKPLDLPGTDAAHETNRRVEFFAERVSTPPE